MNRKLNRGEEEAVSRTHFYRHLFHGRNLSETSRRNRRLSLENLEDRVLLAVLAAENDIIRLDYADSPLSESFCGPRLAELSEWTAESLQSAVQQTGSVGLVGQNGQNESFWHHVTFEQDNGQNTPVCLKESAAYPSPSQSVSLPAFVGLENDTENPYAVTPSKAINSGGETPSLEVTTLSDVTDDTDGLISLREAIAYAGTNGLGNVITFSSSLSGGTIFLAGTELAINTPLTIDASDLYNTTTQTPGITIDAGLTSRVFYIHAESSSEGIVVFNSLTISGGKEFCGGGIYNEGTLQLDHTYFTMNTATFGGAVYNAFDSDLTLTYSFVHGNSANYGGGVYNEGTVSANHLNIYGNTANMGGGINNAFGGFFTTDSCLIYDNNAIKDGGGINNGGTLYLAKSRLYNNSSIQGAGTYNDFDGYFRVTDSSINENTANTYGGGVYNLGELSVSDSFLNGNEAGSGGGIFNGDSGVFNVENSVVLKNIADVGGGLDNLGTATLTNVTVSGNDANSGSGIFNDSGTTSLYNSIVALNTPHRSSNDIFNRESAAINGYYTLSSFAGWTLSDQTMVYDSSKPLFQDPSNGDYNLAETSQAIDCGNNSYINSQFDLNGETRIVNNKVDLGAFEYQTSAIPLTGVTISTYTPTVGTTITASVTPNGATADFQWYRVNTSGTATAINGATSKTYTMTAADFGYYLRVVATGTGSYTGTVFASTDSRMQIESVSLSTDMPKVGTTITASVTPGAATVLYQWYRVNASGSASMISGATSSNYTVTADDCGYYLQVNAIGTGLYSGNAVTTTDFMVSIKLSGISLSTNAPTIGSVITTETIPNGATADYQWYRVGASGTEPIKVGTGSEYTVSESDFGYQLRVVAVGTGNYSGTVRRLTTYTVKYPVTGVTISEHTVDIGMTLTASVQPSDATATYQWYRVDANNTPMLINGANTNSYTVTTADAGYFIKVIALGSGNFSGNVSDVTSVVPRFDDAGDTLSTAMDVVFTDNQFTRTEKIGNLDDSNKDDAKDVDFYQIFMTAGYEYRMTLSCPVNGTYLDTYLRLFDATGEPLVVNDDKIDGDKYSALIFTPKSSGYYYLGVSSFGNNRYTPSTEQSGDGGAIGDYTLTVIQPPPMTPDLVFHQPAGWTDKVIIGKTAEAVSDDILRIDDDVFVRFSYKTTYTFFAMDGIRYNVYVDDDLINSFSDEDGKELNCYDTYEWTLPLGDLSVGDHTLRIELDDNDNVSESDETNNTFIKVFSIVSDVGDTMSTAQNVVFTDNRYTRTEEIGNGNYGAKDVDIYKVYMTAGNMYNISLSCPDGGKELNTSIRLFNESATQVAYNYSDSYSALNYTPTTSGYYYIGVSSYGNNTYRPKNAGTGGGGATGDYILNIIQDGPKDLDFYTPSSWSSAVIVCGDSDATNDEMTDNMEDTYIQFAFSTDSTFVSLSDVSHSLFVDGVLVETLTDPDHDYYSEVPIYKRVCLGKLSDGNHTLEIRLDAGNSVRETNENNNSFIKTFVTSKYQLEAPAHVAVTAKGTSATVTYDISQYADSYTIQYADNSSFLNLITFSADGDSATISQLDAGTYHLRVLAHDTTGVCADSNPSDVVSFTILPILSVSGWNGDYDGVTHGVTINNLTADDTVLYSIDGIHYQDDAPICVNADSYTVYVRVTRSDSTEWNSSAQVIIGKKSLKVNGTKAEDKVYDGTDSAVISLGNVSGIVSGDKVDVTVYGNFNNKNAGAEKSVFVSYSLSGASAVNYTAPENQTLSASISTRQLTISKSHAADKVYDGTVSADVTLGTVSGLISGDDVSISTVGEFNNKNAAAGKNVLVTYTLFGTEATNYAVPLSQTLTASITAKKLTVSGTSVANRVYDGTTQADITLGQVSGILAGDSVTVSADGAFPKPQVGTHSVTVNYSLSGTDESNYTAPDPDTLTATIRQVPPLDAPKNISGTVDGTTATITFDGVTNANSYFVQYTTIENFADYDYIRTTSNFAEIKNLTPDTVYYFRVQARDLDGIDPAYPNSPYSEPISISVPPLKRVSVSVVFSDTAPTLSTTELLPTSLSEIASEQVVYAQVWVRNTDGSSNGITGGYMNLNYSDSVLSVNSITTGNDFSYLADFAATDTPGMITTFGGMNNTDRTDLGVNSWVLFGYVSFTTVQTGTATVSCATPSYDNELDEGLNLTRLGESAPLASVDIQFGSASLDVGCLPLPSPANVTVSSAGANRVTVQWDNVENGIGYEVAWSADQENWVTAQTSKTSYVVSGLTYGATAYFKVKALGDNLQYSDSAYSDIQTLIVCPMDIDGDGRIGPSDMSNLSSAWFSRSSSRDWDPRCDVDGNGLVGPSDRNYVSNVWFKRATAISLDKYPAPLADLPNHSLWDDVLADADDATFITPYFSEDFDFFDLP